MLRTMRESAASAFAAQMEASQSATRYSWTRRRPQMFPTRKRDRPQKKMLRPVSMRMRVRINGMVSLNRGRSARRGHSTAFRGGRCDRI